MSTATIEAPASPASPGLPETPEQILADGVEAAYSVLTSRVSTHCPERTPLLRPILDELWSKRSAPASSRHSNHGAFPGGLLFHILNVMDIMLISREHLSGKLDLASNSAHSLFLRNSTTEAEFTDRRLAGEQVTPEAIVTVALIHDLNKTGDFSGNPLYVENILKSGKRSDASPFTTSDEYDVLTPLRKRLGDHDYMNILLPADGEPGAPQISSGLVSLARAEQISPGIVDVLHPWEKQAIIFHAGLYEKCDKTGFMGCEHPLSILIHFADMLASRVGF